MSGFGWSFYGFFIAADGFLVSFFLWGYWMNEKR